MKRILWVTLGVLLAASAIVAEEEAATTATRSEEAIEILKKVDAAVKAIDSVRYRGKAVPSGVATNFFGAGEGTAMMEGWNGQLPTKFYIEMEGTRPGSEKTVKLTGAGNGENFYVIDHSTKKGYEDMDPGVLGTSGNVLQAIGMLEFVHPTPYDDEINADTVELLGEERVRDEDCYKIHVIYSGARGESIWFFSKNDYLPRRRIQKFNVPGQGEGQLERTIWDVEAGVKLENSLFTMKLPEGYERVDDFAP